MRIFHANASRLHALDPPGMGSQQKNIAGQALDGEILVHRSDYFAVRLRDDRVIRVVRDGAAGGDGGQARSAAALAHGHSPDRDAAERRCGRAEWRCLRTACR